jgi:hypothetical protein
MKRGTTLLLLALLAAPACGGGGGGDSATGGSPGPLSASFVADQPSPGSNTVAMLEGPKNNDIVSVYVTLTDTSGVYGAALEVVFNTADAAYLGFTHGAAFEQGGISPNYTVDGTSNPGRIVIAVSRTGSTGTNIVGSKAMLTLQFRVKQAGTFPVTFENSAIYDAQSPPQPVAGIAWFAGALKAV